GIRVIVRSRRGDIVGEVEDAGRIRGLEEVVVEESLLATELQQVRAFRNHKLGGVAVQGVSKGGVGAALIVEIGPGGSLATRGYVDRGHAIDPVGLLQNRRQLNAGWQRSIEAGNGGNPWRFLFVHAVDCEVAGPDDVGIYRAGVFDRSILRQRGAACDAVSGSVVVEAISKDHRSVVIGGLAAVASADVVAVVDLMINFDIELIIRLMRDAAENVVINWARQIGLRIK